MPITRRFPPGLAAIALTTVVACSEPTEPGGTNEERAPRYSPGLHVLAVPPGDTVDAVAAQRLRIQVVGTDSLPLRDVTVRFEGVVAPMRNPDGNVSYPTLLAASATGSEFEAELALTTDVHGLAEARVRMGRLAGDGRMRVVVPSRGLVDTVYIQVTPGAALALRASPADTAVVLGRAYAFEVYQRDRWWNPVPGGVSYEPEPGIEVAGDSIRGAAYGRFRLMARAGDLVDSLHVSVVPRATLVAYGIPAAGAPGSIILFESDGSGRRVLVGHQGGTGMSHPAWAPSGDRITFAGGPHPPRIFTVTTAGSTPAELPVTAGPTSGHFVPDHSPDGQWIYLAGMPGQQNFALYRIPAAGGAVERIGPDVDWWEVDSRPSVSPDGERVVFATNRATPDTGYTIRILDLASGAVDSLDVPGDAPRWSPTGERIAFTRDDGIHLMQPDGTYLGKLADGREIGWLDWSPDGLWIAASTMYHTTYETYGIELIRVEDGVRIILPYSLPLRLPRFRPE